MNHFYDGQKIYGGSALFLRGHGHLHSLITERYGVPDLHRFRLRTDDLI